MADKVQAVEAEAAQIVEEVKAEAEVVLTEAEQFAVKVRNGVEKWLDAHLRNSAFSQDTGAWNVLQKALPHLAPAITEELN